MNDEELRRLAILKALKASTDYRRSDVLLQGALTDCGLSAPIAVVRSDLLYLEEQGLLSTVTHTGLVIALLNRRGLEVANGIAHAYGVARPQPEA